MSWHTVKRQVFALAKTTAAAVVHTYTNTHLHSFSHQSLRYFNINCYFCSKGKNQCINVIAFDSSYVVAIIELARTG